MGGPDLASRLFDCARTKNIVAPRPRALVQLKLVAPKPPPSLSIGPRPSRTLLDKRSLSLTVNS